MKAKVVPFSTTSKRRHINRRGVKSPIPQPPASSLFSQCRSWFVECDVDAMTDEELYCTVKGLGFWVQWSPVILVVLLLLAAFYVDTALQSLF